MSSEKIPLTIITGFLGAGKTTLLRYILENNSHGKRIAVVENEFATELGAKHELQHAHEHAACVAEIFETSGGCLCCAGSDDFNRVMHDLVKQRDRFDYIVLETTGMADPSFASVFYSDPVLESAFYLDGIVTVVDAKNILAHLDRHDEALSSKMEREEARRSMSTGIAGEYDASDGGVQVINEAVEQLVVADRVLVNKTDLVDKDTLGEIERRVLSLNPLLRPEDILKAQYSQVPVESMLDIKAFNLDNILQRDEGFLDDRPFRQHDANLQSLSLTSSGAYNDDDLREWISSVLKDRSDDIYRSKGLYAVKSSALERVLYQGVHSMVDFNVTEPPSSVDVSLNRFVFIGKTLRPEEIVQSYKEHFGLAPTSSATKAKGAATVPDIEIEKFTTMTPPATGGGGEGYASLVGVVLFMSLYFGRGWFFGSLGGIATTLAGLVLFLVYAAFYWEAPEDDEDD